MISLSNYLSLESFKWMLPTLVHMYQNDHLPKILLAGLENNCSVIKSSCQDSLFIAQNVLKIPHLNCMCLNRSESWIKMQISCAKLELFGKTFASAWKQKYFWKSAALALHMLLFVESNGHTNLYSINTLHAG